MSLLSVLRQARLIILALWLMGLPGLAHAACTVTIQNMVFTYVSGSAAAVNRTSTVTVTCTAGSGLGGYTLALNAGGSGVFASRRMLGPGTNMAYQLYTSAADTFIWGDGSAGTIAVVSASGTPLVGGTDTYTVYGQVAAGLVVNPGNYLDTVTATLTY